MLYWIVAVFLSTIVHGADISYLKQTISNHFSKIRNHEVNDIDKNQVRKFIFEEFRKFGLEAEYHNFTSNVAPMTQFSNVIGILKGDNFGKASDRILGIVAHYDTVNTSPGVDDNGSGVAAMLEVARQIVDQNKNGIKRNNTIIFLSPDLEEYDLVGSEKFIQEWVNAWLRRNYGVAARNVKPHGVIVLDTIMEYNTSSYSQQIPSEIRSTLQNTFPESFQSVSSDSFRGDFVAMIYRSVPDAELAQSISQSWKAEKREQFEIESFPLIHDVRNLPSSVKDALRNFLRSDHYNFWVDNIPAVFLTDSANFRGDMIQCYHNPCDDLATMLTEDNLSFLGKTTDSIARTMHQLSGPTDIRTNSSTRVLTSWLCSMLSLLVLLLPAGICSMRCC